MLDSALGSFFNLHVLEFPEERENRLQIKMYGVGPNQNSEEEKK